MKTLLTGIFLSGLLLALQIRAEDANYDSTSRIISFPRVTIDFKEAYTNAQLKLNLDGSYEILALDPEPELDLTGDWEGELHGLYSPDWSPTIPCGSIITEISFIQNGKKLTGTGIVGSDRASICIAEEPELSVITGEVNGRDVTFTVILPRYSDIHFNGSITGDNATLEGEGHFEGVPNNGGSWSLSLQNTPELK